MSPQPSLDDSGLSSQLRNVGCNDAESLNLKTAFYDVMFQGVAGDAGGLNELEEKVCSEIDQKLEGLDNFSNLVPALPEQLVKITNALGDEDTDFDFIEALIRKDVALAAEVVKMANSPIFRRSLAPIESLSQAVPLIGLDNVANIVSTVLSQRVMSVAPIYFKMFGQKIWNHSLECAAACQSLAGQYNSCLCYLLGLIHDIGKIAIFPALVEGFKSVNPDIKPGGKLFKERMTDYSLWLSWKISGDWGLPDSLTEALGKQNLGAHKEPQLDGLAEVLYQANLCSEVHMLIAADQISFNDGKFILQSKGLSEESIFSIYTKIEASH